MSTGEGVESGYKGMWLFAMFDLPVKTQVDRKRYSRFRKALLREGFTMLQFSVYARYCNTEESSEIHRKHIEASLPPEGQTRLVAITDRQFGKMEVFFGKNRESAEAPPAQLVLF